MLTHRYLCIVKKCFLLFLLTLGLSSSSVAQEIIENSPHIRAKSFYLTWGYNRSNYEETDIRFYGDDFDFTLSGVRGHDLPLPFEARTYLNPLRFTIPQFDFRVGYFLRENLSISGGWDHMKYRMLQYQRVTIEGVVSPEFSETYAGTYSGQTLDLEPSFIRMEHTNGLNNVRFGIEYYSHLWSNKRNDLHLELSLGGSAGLMMPWTDAYVDGKRYKNWIHLSGWSISAQAALKLRFRNFFYFQYMHQNGYLDMTDIIFMDDSPNRAQQSLWYTERALSIGFEIPLYIGGNPNRSAIK
jgi:hypothetical protein